MLILNVLPICKARSIKEPFAFLRKAGFSHSIAHMLAAGKYAKPNLAHIEKLCLLLDCTPHDLLQWHPAEGQKRDGALSALIPRNNSGLEWLQDLKNLPLDKLRSLGAMVKNELSND